MFHKKKMGLKNDTKLKDLFSWGISWTSWVSSTCGTCCFRDHLDCPSVLLCFQLLHIGIVVFIRIVGTVECGRLRPNVWQTWTLPSGHPPTSKSYPIGKKNRPIKGRPHVWFGHSCSLLRVPVQPKLTSDCRFRMAPDVASYFRTSDRMPIWPGTSDPITLVLIVKWNESCAIPLY